MHRFLIRKRLKPDVTNRENKKFVEAANRNKYEDAREATSKRTASVQSKKKKKVRGRQGERRTFLRAMDGQILICSSRRDPFCA